jgi:hypothetical protein
LQQRGQAFGSGLLGADGNAVRGAMATPLRCAMPIDRHPIDDPGAATPAAWRFFTDGVMGGVSSGGMTNEVVAGRTALRLRGQVRLENNGGFIQMALAVPAPLGEWRALELDVYGNGHRYGLHLRTAAMTLPWQAWRSAFIATAEWRTVRLPLASFEPHRTSGTLRVAEVRRIGIVALGERFDADVCVSRLAWTR